MKKAPTAIETPTELLTQIKQYLKLKSLSRIRIQQLKSFSHNSLPDSLFGRIMHYINTKTRFDRSLPNEECAQILRTLIGEDKGHGHAGKFQVDSDGIYYVSRYCKVVDQKTLLAEIQAMPEGLLVDEELLKFSNQDIKNFIQNLIYARLIVPVKSKGIDKSKIKDNNYEGYYLFAYPPEIKESLSSIFCPQIQKRQFESLSKNLEQREQKLKKVYRTKISNYRKDFQNICSANVNRGQSKGNQQQNSESLQKLFNSWNEINRLSVPNFDRQAQEWFKNRK